MNRPLTRARTRSVDLNGTRDGAHTTHHRIPRAALTALVANGSLDLQFRVVNARATKISPVLLGYALFNCHMQARIWRGRTRG